MVESTVVNEVCVEVTLVDEELVSILVSVVEVVVEDVVEYWFTNIV